MIEIGGIQKTSLLDYPDKVCCTIFTKSCNLRCPFCHNASLVLKTEETPLLSEQEIFTFLEKRKGILDGVCITGGEPLLQKEIGDFIYKIKSMGYLVKLDTNGTFPEKLKELVKENLIDYVAMDIKNAKQRYGETIGIPNFDISGIEKSVAFLMENEVAYEFRTTLVREFHTEKEIEEIGKWIRGAKKYFLQAFENSGMLINPNLHEIEPEKMKEFKKILLDCSTNVELRGVR
ncbi:MAG: anaerobic ribonucleoside-triphosphate reductase activating protein [Acetivibrio sp.]